MRELVVSWKRILKIGKDKMKYDAIALDTNIFRASGYILEHGLLAKLSQFKSGSIKFVLSEIVEKEILKHISDDYLEKRNKLETALNDVKRSHLISDDSKEKIKKIISHEMVAKDVTKQGLEKFKFDTNAEIIEANDVDVKKLLELYFNVDSPFENKADKKHEFPDAIALLTLENWARNNQKKVLVVSKDKGWKDFVEKSEQLDIIDNLTDALEKLQEHTKEAKSFVKNFLKDIKSKEYKDIPVEMDEKISVEVESLHPAAEATSSLDYDVDSVEMCLQRFEIVDSSEFSIVQMGNGFVVAAVPINIKYTASATFTFFVYDSIDKDFVFFDGDCVEINGEFTSSLLLKVSIVDDDETSPDIDVDVDVMDIELINVPDSINFGEVEPSGWSDDTTFEKY